jgi:hypothetical protein
MNRELSALSEREDVSAGKVRAAEEALLQMQHQVLQRVSVARDRVACA